jgi:hypothetical protein
MAKAVGFGGVFLKWHDPKALSAWEAAHLGVEAQDGGSLVFQGPESAGLAVLCPFSAHYPYFGEGPQEVTLNFRVDDLDVLLVQLAAAGVRIDPKREDHAYGAFCVDLGY